ncbi:MAG: hydroxyacid dehydrogenase [Deltaproteobacteria bacterium]|nr:hydroxyacid dehydrogenase [Deltaproteobacteria bacterium]
MRIYFCRQGLTYITSILQSELPDDEVLTCAPEQVAEVALDADVLIPTVSRIGEDALRSPRLKLVQQYGAGLDSVDIPAASRYGIPVANVPTAGTGNAESCAELSILFMLTLARKYPQAQENLQQRKLGAPLGMALKGRTAAIIGFGGIGQELARRLAGLEMKVLAVSRRGPKEGDVAVDFHGPQASLPEVLTQADFVIVAPPLNDDTRGLIGQAEFACMKPTAFVINVARGPVLDYEATLAALKEGRIAGAGLDVFWYEPFDPTDPIFSYNVIATPHIGGATDLSLQGIAKKVADNINRVRRGEAPLNCTNASEIRK